ncbi:type II toxin-antitoxin system VapC family toxin [Erwiniaceae bacterium BAC15a-03b]|uniref:Type II toxin-antitoxin system VapC family toxin n=1 Tax=Winslowiella arboricola TaxID=2978220 RepID=A0A9J6PTB3_9GAMM|nr:type II toxin-antitoxin system VapC family toxin [Winslowiella arboricola]MCU5774610.1 type II toxin-antitoxin system VapC family toxin [Winslowiella arboricola]MCU5777980.1 type II toxin-antitoxin system VapC family toxin [Winslowiella arboricola]
MLYLLDTNIISELRKAKSGKADAAVIDWAESVNLSECFISVITVLEIEKGILNKERKDRSQGRMLRSWFEDQVLIEFSKRILAVDKAVALCCARLHVPDKRSEADALIAATAIVHGMTVVTRNTNDFIGMHAPLVNPWLCT